MISCDIYEIRGVCQQLELGTKLQTDDIVAECFGIGKTTVQPFIRLMELMPPILQMGNG